MEKIMEKTNKTPAACGLAPAGEGYGAPGEKIPPAGFLPAGLHMAGTKLWIYKNTGAPDPLPPDYWKKAGDYGLRKGDCVIVVRGTNARLEVA